MTQAERAMYAQLAKGIACQFGSSCEVVVHDLTAEDLSHSIVIIENGHVSGRTLGEGPPHVVWEAMKANPARLENRLAYLTRTRDGKILKSSTMFLQDETGRPRYIFSINYDITIIKAMEEELQHYTFMPHPEGKDPERIPRSVGDLLDELIDQSIKLVGKPVEQMNKEDRMQAIRFLNESGAFLIAKAGPKICHTFGISKYTLYSYLDAAKD